MNATTTVEADIGIAPTAGDKVKPANANTRAARGIATYVGDTRRGVASVRKGLDFYGYILSVVGPDAIPGCTRGAALTFRIDGRPAAATRVANTPPGRNDPLDLRLR